MRTCTGCRAILPKRELVRLVFDGARLVVDSGPAGPGMNRPSRLLPGRGAYVHRSAACVSVAGLSRSLRRAVRSDEVARIVAEMSPADDNSAAKPEGRSQPLGGDQPLQTASQNAPGHEDGDTVEMPPRIKAKDDRSEDARL